MPVAAAALPFRKSSTAARCSGKTTVDFRPQAGDHELRASLGVLRSAGGQSQRQITAKPVKRYTAVHAVTVRETHDLKSKKLCVLQPGETVEVTECGPRSSKGRTRLKLVEPAGWISDVNKQGKPLVEEIQEKEWSTGSIDLQQATQPLDGLEYKNTAAFGQALHGDLQKLDGHGMEKFTAKEEEGVPNGLAASPPRAVRESAAVLPRSVDSSGVFNFEEPDEGVPPLTFGALASAGSGFGTLVDQPNAATTKLETDAAVGPVVAQVSAEAYAYRSEWATAQGNEFPTSIESGCAGKCDTI